MAIRADLDLRVNTDKVKQSLQKATGEINKIVNKTAGKNVGFNVNEKSFTQPLGRINASANEFTKSLEASNARVIAFGASVAIIDGISDSFKQLVIQAVAFEKTLADINAVMSLSNDQLEAFGANLFDAAKNTAQGFNVAAEAALEFSRQGLSTEEVIRRTNDALILTRLTSLKATEAVAGLTAAVNAFGNAGLTTTDIIDKLSAVDVNFAVSSADLINALQRSGAVAIDAGVELDKLVGIVAALQQTTARGGAVIGNSLKTIFTRIQRPESIRQIENLGIVVRDLTGAVLPADKILLNMAKSFDNLTQAQQSNVVQFSAGIFQANVFRAALADLGKENSLTAKATEISANAFGEAARKNELLNKTISAMSSRAATGIQELAAVMGELGLSDSIGSALEFVNERVSEIKNSLGGGEEEGSDFAKGLVKGIGNILTGPAVIAFGAIFIKLFFNIAKFAHNSMKDVLGIVSRKDQLRQMEESIVRVMGENASIQQALNNLEGDRAAQEAFILGIIERQTNALQKQKALAKELSSTLLNKGISPDLTYNAKGGQMVDLDGDGKPDIFGAGGLLPQQKRSERIGALKGGYAPGEVATTDIKGIGRVIYNKAETIKQFPGMQQPAIMPPKQSKAGRKYADRFQEKHGFDPYASRGLIPNFEKEPKRVSRFISALKEDFQDLKDLLGDNLILDGAEIFKDEVGEMPLIKKASGLMNKIKSSVSGNKYSKAFMSNLREFKELLGDNLILDGAGIAEEEAKSMIKGMSERISSFFSKKDKNQFNGLVPNFASMSGHKLSMSKSKLKLFGNSSDIAQAIKVPWPDIANKMQNKTPIPIESDLNSIITSSSDNQAPTKKERLYKTFVSLASDGVRTIERDFDMRALPKRRNTKQLKGESGGEFAERLSLNVLNKEQLQNKKAGLDHSQYIQTRDPVTKKGAVDYPVDIIALGRSFPSYEVKSGEIIAANILSKSLRMASDTELEDWMESRGMKKKDLGQRNLAGAQRLARKLGIKGTGKDDEFTQEDAENWGMSKGFVPNFTGGLTMAAKSLASEFDPKNVSNITHLKYVALAKEVERAANADPGDEYDKSISTIAAEMGISESTISNSKNPSTTSGEVAKGQLGSRYDDYVNNLNKLKHGKLSYHIQRGIDFEQQLLDIFKVGGGTNRTAPMDYIQNEFAGKDKRLKKRIEMLNDTKHGDAYAGPQGHAVDHFIAKAVRQQDPNIAGFLRGSSDSKRILNNQNFRDIIGTTGGKKDDVIKGVASISDIAEHSKIWFRNKIRDAGYNPPASMSIEEFIRDNENLRDKKITYKYTKDFVDIKEVLKEHAKLKSQNSYSGNVPNFAKNYNLDSILKELASSKNPDAQKIKEKILSGEISLSDLDAGGENLVIKGEDEVYKIPQFNLSDGSAAKTRKEYIQSNVNKQNLGTEILAKALKSSKVIRGVPAEFATIMDEYGDGVPVVAQKRVQGKSLEEVIGGDVRGQKHIDGIINQIQKNFKSSAKLKKAEMIKSSPGGKLDKQTESILDDFILHGADLHTGNIIANPKFEKVIKGLIKNRQDLSMFDDESFDVIDFNKGFIPNYNIKLGDKYFNERQVRAGIKKLFDSKQKYNEEPLELSREALNNATTRYISLINDKGTRYPGGDFMIGGQKVLTNEVAMALQNHGQFYRPEEGETIEDFSKGLIPNFKKKKKRITDEETGTYLDYKNMSPGYAEITHIQQGKDEKKGGAFRNFNKLMGEFDAVGSGMLTPQKAGSGPTSWAKIVSMFPQIKHRIQPGLKTIGDFAVDDTEFDFKSLVDLKKQTNRFFKDIPDAEVFLTHFGKSDFFDDMVSFQNLTTSRVEGDGDGKVGFKSKGLVPNFYNLNRRNLSDGDKMSDRQKLLKMWQDKMDEVKKSAEKIKQGGARKDLDPIISKLNAEANEIWKQIQKLKNNEDYYIPSFANPLVDAINRERSAGLPDSKIRIEKSAQLKGPRNPMGLAVTNTRDEPAGVQQGISRARSMGIDPKKHGASGGFVPNYIDYDGQQYENFKMSGPEVTNVKAANKAAQVKNIDAASQSLKNLAASARKAEEGIEEESDARENSETAQIDGLQKLFYMQSTISMANGFLQQFAETGTGVTKQLAEFSLGLSDTLSTFITAKEVGNQLMDVAGFEQKDGIGLGDLFKKSPSENKGGKANKKGLGASISKSLGGLMKFGKGLLRFAPLVGQAVTIFTAANAAVKQFGHLLGFERGAGIMDLLSSTAEKAARNIEKLSKSTEALENALGALQSQSETNQKIQDLESMGNLRTQKQETELFQLKMKEIDIQAKVQKSMSQLFEENVVGTSVAEQLSNQFNQSGITVEEQTKTLQKLIKVQKQRIAIEEGTKSFGKLIEDKFDDFSGSFDFSDITGEDLKLLKQASTFRGAQAGMALSGVMAGDEEMDPAERLRILSENIDVIGKFDLNAITDSSARGIKNILSKQLKGTKEFGGSLIAEHIGDFLHTIDDAEDNMIGFEGFEAEAAHDALTAFVNQLKKQRENLEKENAGEVFEESTKAIRDAYVKIISEYKDQRAKLVHQNSLSNKINSTQRKIEESNTGILSKYLGVSKAFEIRQKTENELTSINEKYLTQVLKHNTESLKGMQKTAEGLINIGQLAQDFTLGMERSKEGVGKLIANISKGINLNELSSVVDRLGVDLSGAQSSQLNQAFLDVAKEIQLMEDNGEVVNSLMEKYGKILDPTVAAAFLVALNEKKIAGLQEKDIQALSKIVKAHQRSVESAELDRDTSQKLLKNKEVQELIQAKTVDGAKKLQKLLEKQGNLQGTVLREIEGETATLKVVNDFQKRRVSILLSSGGLDDKAKQLQIEKNRKDAEGAILSLEQVKAQRDILNLQNENSEEYKNIIRAQQAKFRQEVVSAQLSEQEAQAREEFFSYEETRKKLAEAQIATEQSNARTTASINLTKLQIEVAEKKILENVKTQIEEEITAAQRSALVSAARVSILNATSEQSKLLKRANELQEASNKYLALENAIRQATISRGDLDINARADFNTEKANKILAVRESIARNNILTSKEELASLVKLELEEELQSVQQSALMVSEKAIILSEMGEQGKLLRKANELQESSNKLIELENAIRKATISKSELALSTATQIGLDRANSMADTRGAAAKALMTGNPEDVLAFAQNLEETNKQLGIGSRALDRLRTRIAEINVSWQNLGADLVDIGLNSARSGVKKVFEEIGSGAKTAEQAWNDFGLNLAKDLLDRFTEANVDRIFANLAYAFTGVDPSKSARQVVDIAPGSGFAQGILALNTLQETLSTNVSNLQNTLKNGIKLRSKGLDEGLIETANQLGGPMDILGKKIDELRKAVEKDTSARTAKDSKPGESPGLVEENSQAFKKDLSVIAQEQSLAGNRQVSEDLGRAIDSIDFPRPASRQTSKTISKETPVMKNVSNPVFSLFSKEQQENIVAAASPSFQAGYMSPSYHYSTFNRNAERMGIKTRAHSEPLVPYDAGYTPFTLLNHIVDPDSKLGDKELSELAESAGMRSDKANEIVNFSETFRGLEELKEKLLDIEHSVKNSAGAKMPLEELDGELNKMVVSATGAKGSIGNVSEALLLLTETMAQQAQKIKNILSGTTSINPTGHEIDQQSVSDGSGKHFGGIVQKFAQGGFVKGPSGEDKVPAMLTAGEYVIPKERVRELAKGGYLENLYAGGKVKSDPKTDRLISGIKGATQAATMAIVTDRLDDAINKKQDKPPTFNMQKLKNMDLGSDVSLRSGDPRLSGKALARDPAMAEYRDYLMDLASYRVQKKNEKFQKRMGVFSSILGAVHSFIGAEFTEIAKEPINKYIVNPVKSAANKYIVDPIKSMATKADNWRGKTFGKYNDEYQSALKMAESGGYSLNYKDFRDSMDGYRGEMKDLGFYMDQGGIKFISSETGKIYDMNSINEIRSMPAIEQKMVHASKNLYNPLNRSDAMNQFIDQDSDFDIPTKNKFAKEVRRASGGSIPTMLTDGEAVIPSSVAKRIGYKSLNRMNRTGQIPIVRGPKGIDKVGPVGLQGGDFVIRKSSTDKLLKENPHMMRFALQNPDGFRKAEQRYYEGGIVGTSGSTAVAPVTGSSSGAATQASTGPVNRIQPLIEATQPNKTQASSQSTNNDVTNNINVNVTVDQSGNEKVSAEAGGNTFEQEQALAMKIKTKVIEVIREEKRIGGELG